MTGRVNLERFLRTDPEDAGCERTLELLHVYVEPEIRHSDAAKLYPDVAVHLAACAPCREDHEGLLMLAG